MLGLLTLAIMSCVFLGGIGLSLIKRAARKRDQEPPESIRLVARVHKGIGWLVWLLLVINNGL